MKYFFKFFAYGLCYAFPHFLRFEKFVIFYTFDPLLLFELGRKVRIIRTLESYKWFFVPYNTFCAQFVNAAYRRFARGIIYTTTTNYENLCNQPQTVNIIYSKIILHQDI